MYQRIMIIGRLGGEPEMRYTPQGKAVTSFSVAVSNKYGDKEDTAWFRVSVWENQAEACNQYLHKGSKVFVEGRLVYDESGSPRIFERKDKTVGTSFEISASRVLFLDSKNTATEPVKVIEDYDDF